MGPRNLEWGISQDKLADPGFPRWDGCQLILGINLNENKRCPDGGGGGRWAGVGRKEGVERRTLLSSKSANVEGPWTSY